MIRILQIALGWGLALGLAGSIIVIVYLGAPQYIEQHLDLQQRTQIEEMELKYRRKQQELDIEMEEKQKVMRLRAEQNALNLEDCKRNN